MRTAITVALVLVTQTIVADAGGFRYPLRFAVIGDRTGGVEPSVYEDIVMEIERLKPDLVLTVGDMVEGPAPDSTELERRWGEYERIVSPLSVPLYFTPGNNDIWDDLSDRSYLRHAGEPYHSFEYHDCHFVILDTSRWETTAELSSAQLAWLVRDLHAHRKALRTFVFFHKPFWLSTTAIGMPDHLHELFLKTGVDAVFTGHVHTYMSGRYDGILYTSVGSSGGRCQPGPTGLGFHYVWVTADKHEVSVAPLRRGSALPWDEVTSDDVYRIEDIGRRGIRFLDEIRTSEGAPVDQRIAFVACNLCPDASIGDTLRWNVPPGWLVDPSATPLSLAQGESLTLAASVTSAGVAYPLPALTLRAAYRVGHMHGFTWALPLRRVADCGSIQECTLEGVPNEPGWGTPVTRLFAPEGGASRIDSTAFWFAHDESTICLGAWCRESTPDSMRALVTERDGPVHSEDCVGYFIQPDRAIPAIYQVYVNPRGLTFDQRIEIMPSGAAVADRAWNGNFEIATTVTAEAWGVEIRIPASQLGGTISPTAEWGINFRRKQWRTGTAADWQIPMGYEPSSLGVLAIR